MPYFKDSSGALHFLSEVDVTAGFKSLLPDGCEEIGEDEAKLFEFPTPTGHEIAFTKITALEATITSRRLREAVLGADGGWLKAINDKISDLRAGLTSGK